MNTLLDVISGSNLIHKSDVYFNILEPTMGKLPSSGVSMDQMQHGDIYIFSNHIYLRNNDYWYKMNIQEIKYIKTVIPINQMQIKFRDFDIVLSCKQSSDLIAMRDFLNVSQNYLMTKNFMLLGSIAK